MKVKLTKLFHPNISKLTTENGGRGTHFAKFLISLFQWGLTHSAMMIQGSRHLSANIVNCHFCPFHTMIIMFRDNFDRR